MFRSLKTYSRLDPRQRAGVKIALREAFAVKRILKDSGYGDARMYLADRPPAFPESAPSDADAVLADRAIRAFPRRLLCLERSLVVQWIAGPNTEVRFGVSAEGEYRFHAWVEREGTVLNDRSDIASEFTPFGEALASTLDSDHSEMGPG